jgi:dethiobiotin synthetase
VTAVFVTSTGTEIGKTFVTAGLIRHLRKAGRTVGAIKPIVSGYDPSSAAAAAPDLAAKLERRSVDFRTLVTFCERAMAVDGLLLIEGVGGVMVPLDDRHTVIDWISALRVPVILVVGSYLGTISHTLTALHVLAQRNLATLAVVVSETPGSPVPLDETVASISRFADLIDVIALPRLADGGQGHPAFGTLAALL